MAFPFVSISGGPFERGRQFGQACGDQIRRYPEVLRTVVVHESRLRDPNAQVSPPDDAELMRRAHAFLPWIERFAPEQVEEMRGIAAGADVPLDWCCSATSGLRSDSRRSESRAARASRSDGARPPTARSSSARTRTSIR